MIWLPRHKVPVREAGKKPAGDSASQPNFHALPQSLVDSLSIILVPVSYPGIKAWRRILFSAESGEERGAGSI